MAKILLIDDEPSVRETVSRILEAEGHRVVSVEDGVYAMKAIKRESPDLILCDLVMPRLDGFALIEHLKYDSKSRAVPVVALTALNDENSRLFARQLAVDHYLAKPFDPAELIEIVSELLARNRVKMGRRPKARKIEPDSYLYIIAGIVLFLLFAIALIKAGY